MTFDTADLILLEALQTDCKQTHKQLALKTDLSVTESIEERLVNLPSSVVG